MKLVMVGPVPPPLGGISIHIRRLSERLRAEGMECVIYNEANRADDALQAQPIGSYKKLLLLLPFIRGDLFHFHSIDARIRMLLGAYKAFGKKIVLTIHGDSLALQLNQARPLARSLLLGSLKRLDYIVCVNEATTRMLLEFGFEPSRVGTIPAYIHPVERSADALKIPAEVHRFMAGEDFLISANGFVRLMEQGDLYGLDLLVELMRTLSDQGLPARLLFAMLGASEQSPDERAYYGLIQQRVRAYGLSDNVYFYEASDTEFYPILQESSLFIRPTRLDGYGVSIAEALHYQVPAIASDVCKRPEGTLLFRSGDLQELVLRVRETMQEYGRCKREAVSRMVDDYAADVMAIYNQISGVSVPAERKVITRANR
ncbi:glycosyltransferase family 4 protein [Paenibacillus chibensis]|uniref:Glycosyltransferase family 4 protein n=1 Tax=Paenibacillus chibensis TaxID=59846 RepID=A0ABU6PMQ9_9BACL|nr:glycosyltransferase family 4 protein [Paenibacillus chibensis]